MSSLARFLRWRWAPGILLATGSLAAVSLVVLSISFALEVSKRSRAARVRGGSDATHSPVGAESQAPSRDEGAPRTFTATQRPSPPPLPVVASQKAGLDSFFHSTPSMELPAPLDEPPPPPEPAAAPIPTEMSVPARAPTEIRPEPTTPEVEAPSDAQD